MSEPKQLQPQYLGSSKNAPAPRNPMVAFWNDQVMAPEHRSENLGILKATAIFVVGVVFIRSDLSSALVPVF